jgi:hypothetical protein
MDSAAYGFLETDTEMANDLRFLTLDPFDS